MTKKHEENIYTTIENAITMYAESGPRGEYALVIEGLRHEDIDDMNRKKYEGLSIEEHMDMYISEGNGKKEAMKLVAKDRGVSKREIYDTLLGR